MGYKFQFITLAGFHTQNIAIFELAQKYKKEGMSAYSKIQEQEFAREKDGYTSCLLYTSPSPRDRTRSRMPSSA